MKRTMNHKLTMTALSLIILAVLWIYGWAVASDLMKGKSYQQVLTEHKPNVDMLLYLLLCLGVGLIVGIVAKYLRHRNRKLNNL